MSVRTFLAGLWVIGATGCSSSREVLYVAPTPETVTTGAEIAASGDGQRIYVENRSTVPIVVTGLHLRDCENIKNRCDPTPLRIRVPPRQRVTIATVRPDNPARPYSYRYNFTWAAESPRSP